MALQDDGLISGLREDQLVTAEEVDSAVRESIESAVGANAFQHSKVNAWTSNIVEGALKRLAGLQKPFKYVVSVSLIQKLGAGFHTASTTYWDTLTDGKFTVQWENPTIVAIVTVFWSAI